MEKKTKPKKHEEHMGEAWLLPYADVLTLLLALFIVLYASSNIDKEKLQEIASGFRAGLTSGFGGYNGSKMLGEEEPPDEMTGAEFGLDLQLETLYNDIQIYLQQNNLEESIELSVTSESVMITLANDIWFDSGSAYVSDKMTDSAKALAGLLSKSQVENNNILYVAIIGHTDNIPINNDEFTSNWHLSVMRAVNFMHDMIEYSNLNPKYFNARGYGEYEPIDTNDTAEGRRHNRRVEVMISLAPEVESDADEVNDEVIDSYGLPIKEKPNM